jgi:hypothetical protein
MVVFLITGFILIRKSGTMKAEEIGELEIFVNKLKFIAGQKASDLHDLIEDRLMTDFEKIPFYSETVYTACKEWNTKNKELLDAKQQLSKI